MASASAWASVRGLLNIQSLNESTHENQSTHRPRPGANVPRGRLSVRRGHPCKPNPGYPAPSHSQASPPLGSRSDGIRRVLLLPLHARDFSAKSLILQSLCLILRPNIGKLLFERPLALPPLRAVTWICLPSAL